MINRLKKDASQFKKRSIKEYLEYLGLINSGIDTMLFKIELNYFSLLLSSGLTPCEELS